MLTAEQTRLIIEIDPGTICGTLVQRHRQGQAVARRRAAPGLILAMERA
jgi:hypothetical protein